MHRVVRGDALGGGAGALAPGQVHAAVGGGGDGLDLVHRRHVLGGRAVDVQGETVGDGGAGAGRAVLVAKRAAEDDPAQRRARVVGVVDVLDPVVEVAAVVCRHAARGGAGGVGLAGVVGRGVAQRRGGVGLRDGLFGGAVRHGLRFGDGAGGGGWLVAVARCEREQRGECGD